MPKCVVAVASKGGHWVQLRRLAPAVVDCQVTWVSTAEYAVGDDEKYVMIRDASRSNVIDLIVTAVQLIALLRKVRPDVVITTGAAPGLIAVVISKYLGASTIWVDSLANVDQLSASGRIVRRWADLWLTQWEHLAAEGGPDYLGRVL